MDTLFSITLRQLRKENNISAEELAQKLNINKSTISRYETSKTEPYLPIVIKIANYFNVSIDWLSGVTDIKNWQNSSKTEIISNFEELPDDKKKELLRYSNYLKNDLK